MNLNLASNMIKILCPLSILKNGITISQLGITTTSKKVFNNSIDNGINFFDMKVPHKIYPYSNKIFLYTKLELYKPLTLTTLFNQKKINTYTIENTINKLYQENIDVIFIDGYNMNTSNLNTSNLNISIIIDKIKKDKNINTIGLIVDNIQTAQFLLENTNIDLLLLTKFNIFEMEDYINLFNIAQKNNIDIIIENKYNMNLFNLIPYTIYNNFNDNTIKKRDLLHILYQNNISTETFLMQYPLQYKNVKSIIVDCKNENSTHIIDNFNNIVPLHVWKNIDSILF